MTAANVPLVADPELRASLRRLYPGYPAILQAWLIAEPGAPLPDLLEGIPTSVGVAEDLRKELRKSLRYLQAHRPDIQWCIESPARYGGGQQRYLTVAGDGPHLDCDLVASALPHGALVGYREMDHTDAWDAKPVFLPVAERACHGAVIELYPGDAHEAIVEYGDLQLTLAAAPVIVGQSEAAERDFGLDTFPSIVDGVIYDEQHPRWVPADEERPAHDKDLVETDFTEILGDGVGRCLTFTHTTSSIIPDALQKGDISSTPVIQMHQRDRLLERWRKLPAPEDRERIAGFWFGHPHPILAAAGLATFAAINAGEITTGEITASPAMTKRRAPTT